MRKQDLDMPWLLNGNGPRGCRVYSLGTRGEPATDSLMPVTELEHSLAMGIGHFISATFEFTASLVRGRFSQYAKTRR